MEYTVEEKNLIADKAKEIETWIESNIVPHIQKRIHLEFGGTYVNPRNGSATSNFKLLVCPTDDPIKEYGVDFKVENSFCVGSVERFSSYCPLESFNRRDAAVYIIRNWGSIKKQLLDEVEAQKSFVEELKNFKI